MFPLTSNEAYIKSTGERSTLGRMLEEGGNEPIEAKLNDEIKTRAALGAHNLMSYDYVLPSSGGVTFTHNADGTFTVSGTATSQDAALLLKSIPAVPTGNYFISGFASVTNLNVNAVYLYKNGAYVAAKSTAVVDNEIPLVIGAEDYDEIRIVFRRTTDDMACTGILYPMLRLATDADTTYQPYAMTNQELTRAVAKSTSGSYLVKHGNLVQLAVNTWTAISSITIPADFRPEKQMIFVIEQRKESAPTEISFNRLTVGTDGTITLVGESDQLLGSAYWFTA